ncbi:hypothetical protein KCTC52924_03579 [Arenibacter antarcticus]|uniref:Uncharacterized protein n=1 Tax=Arenibacter antarcticus TaxID=2040469 RepID=A0ABW5VEA2_9FLAO|nr:hypothetical protein [Arenibacter sp. H213]MCM4169802.1 hypothetical protein [Arenibacter sp. H213]
MKTDKPQEQNNIDLELFYQALEDNPELLEDAFETILEMVNSEPKSAKKLALLIKEDFHDLYKEIAELCTSDQDKGNTPACCGGH